MELLNSVKYMYDMVKYTFNVSRNDLIDPLSIILKLGLLSFKPSGTKISIHNHKLLIQENTMIQGTIRTVYGDKQTDINILYGPIIFACVRYLDQTNRDKMMPLFKLASLGLTKLKKTYNGKDIIYNIEQLKNIIDLFITNPDIEPTSFIANYQSESYKLKTNIYTHIGTIWNSNRLDIIFGLNTELLNSNDNTKNELVYSLVAYLDFIDIKIGELISEL
jgi:hypothetical protein